MTDTEERENEFRLVKRPLEELHQLPLQHRWEVTRRHPYYLRLWQTAGLENANVPERDAARMILAAAVNVVGIPASPSTNFDELNGGQVDASFLGGALTPMTYRGFAMILAHQLDQDALRQIGNEFLLAAEVDRSDSAARYDLLKRLNELPIPALDLANNESIISLNPRSPIRAIVEDIQRYVSAIKQKHGIQETRRRIDKIDEYLEVWDQREGWTGLVTTSHVQSD